MEWVRTYVGSEEGEVENDVAWPGYGCGRGEELIGSGSGSGLEGVRVGDVVDNGGYPFLSPSSTFASTAMAQPRMEAGEDEAYLAERRSDHRASASNRSSITSSTSTTNRPNTLSTSSPPRLPTPTSIASPPYEYKPPSLLIFPESPSTSKQHHQSPHTAYPLFESRSAHTEFMD